MHDMCVPPRRVHMHRYIVNDVHNDFKGPTMPAEQVTNILWRRSFIRCCWCIIRIHWSYSGVIYTLWVRLHENVMCNDNMNLLLSLGCKWTCWLLLHLTSLKPNQRMNEYLEEKTGIKMKKNENKLKETSDLHAWRNAYFEMGERGLLGFMEFPFILWRIFTPWPVSSLLKSMTWNLLIREDGESFSEWLIIFLSLDYW
jgi:hypothetical protein